MVKKDRNFKSILSVLLIVVIFIVLVYGSKILFKEIQNLLFYNDEVIFISPGSYSYQISFLSFIVLSISIFQLFKVLIKGIHFDKKLFSKKKRIIRTFIIYLFILSGILLPMISFFNYKSFNNKTVLLHSGIPFRKKVYNYNEVKKIEVDRFEGVRFSMSKYELIMKDGEKINLTADDSDMHYLFTIEQKLQKNIPHEITNKAYRYFIERINRKQFDTLNWVKAE